MILAVMAMRKLDIKSSLVAGLAGAILLVLIVQLWDAIENDTLSQCTSSGVFALLGFIVGFSVQAAERLTGTS
jgi:hypothetical protein